MLMKRLSLIAFISVLALITSNVYFYINSYRWQTSTHQTMFGKTVEVCCRLMEKDIKEKVLFFEHVFIDYQNRDNDLGNLGSLFNDGLNVVTITEASGTSTHIEKSFDGGINVTKKKTNVPAKIKFGWDVKEDTNEIIYAESFEDSEGSLLNIELIMDKALFFRSFMESCEFSEFHFLWVFDANGKIVFNSLGNEILKPEFKSENTFKQNQDTAFTHQIQMGQEKVRVLSVFHHFIGDNSSAYLVFSCPVDNLTRPILKMSFVYALITIIIIILIIVFFANHIRNQALEQERVKQSEVALTKVLHYLPTGIILMDNNRRVRQVNRAAVKLFQLEDEDVVLGQVLNENLLFSRFRIKEKYNVTAQGIRYIVIDTSNKERVIFNDKIPFFLQSEKFYLESFHELTSYIQPADKDLHGFQSGFMTNISHELRTPLNGILGMVDMLLNSPSLPEPEKEMTILAKRSAETLFGLINDILDYSRLEAGKFEVESIPFNLKEEVDSLIKEFLPEAREKKIVITTTFNEMLPLDFIGDPVRFRQLLSNLINNAIKFTPFGTVQIATSQAKAVNGGPAIMFSIKDSGIGINQDQLEKIFEPFSQADLSLTRSYGGTGLGTTISKHLVLLMGGEIWAKSPSGLSPDPQYPGAEIFFTLPLKTRKFSKKLDFSGIYSFAQLKCLVVSDDTLQVQVISRNLIALGVDFKVLPPSRETINLLKDKIFHMVVIDHRFDLNGLDFMQEMHNYQLHKDFLIILQSSDFQASNTTLAHRLGADLYLRKPIAIATLREVLLNNFPNLMARERDAALSVPEDLKIMAIEDNVLNQKVIRNLFRKIGYELVLVASVEEAFKKLNGLEFDLILVDFYILQSTDGSFISEIKEKKANCPVVVMASSFDLNDDTRNLLLHYGVDDFLLKPFDMQLVAEILFRMVAP